MQAANWGDLNATNESSVSESPSTQILATPSQSIGRGLVRNQNIEEEKQSEATPKVDKTGTENNKSCDPKGTNEGGANMSVETIIPIVETNAENNSNFKEPNPISKNVDEVLVDKKKKNSESVSVNASETPKPTLAEQLETNRKRGSLDLFDSPVQREKIVNDVEGINIEEENVVFDSSDVEVMLTSKQDAKLDASLKNEKNVTEENKNRESLGNQQASKHNEEKSKNESANKSSFFFDSPMSRNESVEDNAAFSEKLDANIGGESLLEISSFVVGTQDNDMGENELNVLDANIGGESILELSSFLSDVEGKKRKRSLEAEISRKKLKSRETRTSTQAKVDTGDELQVSYITSTENNVKPGKTSTPSLSQYFGESGNVESPIVFDRTLPNNSPPVLVEQVQKGNEDQVNHKENEENILDENLSFTLELSRELSDEGNMFCDSEFNIDSKMCDILDGDNNSDKNNDAETETPLVNEVPDTPHYFSDDKMDSKLGAILDVQNAVKEATTSGSKREVDNPKGTEPLGVNKKLSFSESVNIDSQLDALLVGDESQIGVKISNELLSSTKLENEENKAVVTDEMETATDVSNHFKLNTQLCEILDNKGSSKKCVEESKDKLAAKSSKTFECSEFDMNSQLCDVLDNYNQKGNENKKPVIMTDSMEVNEIQRLNFDDDTVLGTPVNHHKSISFKNCGSKKVTRLDRIVRGSQKKRDHFSMPNTFTVKDRAKHVLEEVIEEKKECYGEETEIKVTMERIPSVEEPKKEERNATAPTGDSLTNTILEAAFESSFNLETAGPHDDDDDDDEVLSSQKSPTTPHKSLQDR